MLFKQLFDSTPNKGPASITIFLALILVTPLCGWLFSCGCDWPWLGLDAGCNYHQSHALHKCPWCNSLLTGWLSVGLAIAAGTVVTVHPLVMLNVNSKWNSLFSILEGLLAFVGVAVVMGWLAAMMQDYPFKMGSLLFV